MINTEWNDIRLGEYRTLTQGVGWVDVGPRTEIAVTGRDRQHVVNNFCTADIRSLETGQGSEAFLLNIKGMALAHVAIFVSADQIEISTVPNQARELISHLQQYVVSEKVDFLDRSDQTTAILVAGPDSANALVPLIRGPVPVGRMDHIRTEIGDTAVALRRTDLLGNAGFELVIPVESKSSVARSLLETGIAQCAPEVLETIRIENRIPKYGIDIDSKNLPQEIGRDAQAISFTKGCYLGQETVARLDSLGHVNRHWVALRLDSLEVPKTGTLNSGNGSPLARITSATWSPKYGAPLALAFVRNGQHSPGNVLATEIGNATVVD